MPMMRRPVFAWLCALLLLSGCADVGSDATIDADSKGIRDIRLHATMTEELNLRLGQLDALTDDDNFSEADRQAEELRRLNAIAITADRLRLNAIDIQSMAPSLGLSQPDQERFLDLAGQLESYTSTLVQAAQDSRSNTLPALMANINGTCATCHALYRSP